MNLPKTVEAGYAVEGARIALVVGRWHDVVVDALQEGCLACLYAHGVKDTDVTIFRAPGAYEIPLIAKRIAAQAKFDAIITLGAVIRGGTPHFEYVAGACVDGMSDVSLAYDVPVAFGVLTVDNMEQALERVGAVPGSPIGHKGEEAALAALEMINLLKLIDEQAYL